MSFTGKLRPFQEECADLMIEHQNFLVVHQMGLGKTVEAIAVCEYLIEERFADVVLIICPASVKWQWARQIRHFTDKPPLLMVVEGDKYARESQYRSIGRGKAEYVIMNYEQVVNDWNLFRYLEWDVIVADECFAAGTLVDTPNGPQAIETLHEGDLVHNAQGVGRVRRVIEKRSQTIVKVALESGECFLTTPNHRFLTTVGWQPAIMLTHGSSLIKTSEAMRMVQSTAPPNSDSDGTGATDHPTQQESVLQQILLSELENAPTFSEKGRLHACAVGQTEHRFESMAPVAQPTRTLGAEQARQGGLDERLSGASKEDLEREWEHDQRPPGEWYGPNSRRSLFAGGSPQTLAMELHRSNQAASTHLSFALQVGLGVAHVEAGSGSGRVVAPTSRSKKPRSEEDAVFGVSRVDRVEVFEQGSLQWAQFSGSNHSADVYDLEIEGHPSYSVNGVLVHNCSAIKSFTAKRSRYVKLIDAPFKFGLTGQPIENRPEELFSIMEWVDRSVLGPFKLFERHFIVRDDYGRVKFCKNLRYLRDLMAGSMHRVSREEVADQLPAVVEEAYVIDFDRRVSKIYDHVSFELLQSIRGTPRFGTFSLEDHYSGQGDDSAAFGDIMPKLMALRMLCDHPRLLEISADNFDDPDTRLGSKYAAELREKGLVPEGLKSQKMAVTIETIEEILEADPANKIVLFSFFKPMLDLLREKVRCGSELYTGDLTARERDDAKERFQRDPKCRVLFSSDAGGIGVDIPAANHLISFDLPWSSGKWAQRKARIDRISSEWESITLLSMVMRGSIEERMLDMLEQKAAMANAWIDGKGLSRQGTFEVTLSGLADWLEEH